MVEQIRTQLFMMLVQQAGSGALPLSNLIQEEFLPFFRHIEESVTMHGLSPVLVYWSAREAQWLLPDPAQFRNLSRDAYRIFLFSEERPDKQDEFCFLAHSRGISMVVYGHKSDDAETAYQCVGSIDPHIVKRAFQFMIPVFQFIDLPEANRLEDARNHVGSPVTAPHFVAGIRAEWPILKKRSEGDNLLQIAPNAEKNVSLPLIGDNVQNSSANTLKNSQLLLLPGESMEGESLAAKAVNLNVSENVNNFTKTNSAKNYGDPSLLQEFEEDIDWQTQTLTSANYLVSQDLTALSPPKSNSISASEKKTGSRSMRELRDVWTNITEEARTVFAPDAQKIIRDIVHQLRISSDIPSILQLATEELTKLSKVDRGMIWQVVDGQLCVTNEFAMSGHQQFVDNANLGAQESTAICSEFLSRFPDESGSGVIAISDTINDTKLRRISPTLAALIELADVRARLVAQIRCRGSFHGFIELQQCKNARDWSEQDAAVLQSVSEVLSLVVQQSYDLAKIEEDAEEMKLINEISSIFRDSGGQNAQYTIEKSVKLIAEHMDFLSMQVFLYSEADLQLIPQIHEKEHSSAISFTEKNNHFLQVFESGKLKLVNLEYSKRLDHTFGHDTALIIPLMSEGERFGVLGLWKRRENSPILSLQDREVASTLANSLASYIRADQVIAQIRQERARAGLINTVSEKIDQSLKEVSPILETLVGQLADYFNLGLCAVSVFDTQKDQFGPALCAGGLKQESNAKISDLADNLFAAYGSLLRQGQTWMLQPQDVFEAVGNTSVELPESIKLTMLLPLLQGESLKGSLCMISCHSNTPPSVQEMHMIRDLLSRVSVVLAHKELFEQVERQAITDGLTGLFNRRYFEEQLGKELDRHQRFGHSCSFIILDLDHFKSVNDTLEHHNGDIALKHTAAILKKCVRDVDTVGRLGGEEFVVLLPETDENAARVVAERICNAIRDSRIEQFQTQECAKLISDRLASGKVTVETADRLREGRITASIGVSTFPKDAQDKAKLMELADKCLYVAKGRGRNQVISSSKELAEALSQNPNLESVENKDKQAVVATKSANLDKVARVQVSANVNKSSVRSGDVKNAENMASTESAETRSQAKKSFNPLDNYADVDVLMEDGILGIFGNIIKDIAAKDGYSKDRSPRAANYASRLALALRLSKEHSTIISLAAILSNLGKLVIDEQVLKKAEELTEEEWNKLEEAPTVAAKILEPAKHLHKVATVIESYHEHWDGTGYPRGLKGEDIPLESRIIAVVDAYIAMTSDRPYRSALTHADAVICLKEGAGYEWDPRIVKLFLSLLDKEANSK